MTLTAALVVTISVITPPDSSEAHTQAAKETCMRITDPNSSTEERYATCMDLVLDWIEKHDGDLDELRQVEPTTSPTAAATSSPTATPSSTPSSTPSASATLPAAPKQSAAPQTPAPAKSSAPVTESLTKEKAATSNPTAAAKGFTAAFGTRPNSGVVNCDGQSNVTITGKTFRGIGNDTPAISIRNCTNVRIVQNDFIDDTEPIYVYNSKNVTIEYNRYRNITGPHERNGSNRGNFTQWNNSFGGSISHNTGVGGDTEDIVSIYKSGGLGPDQPLVISDNWFQGTNWTSGSGSGIMLGDSGGAHVVIKDNTLINPGQVGIGVAGGQNIRVTGNTVLGQPRAASNVGIYVWGQGTGCSGVHVGGNTVDFAKESGAASGGWNGGNCGAVTGWDTNNWTAKIPFDRFQVRL